MHEEEGGKSPEGEKLTRARAGLSPGSASHLNGTAGSGQSQASERDLEKFEESTPKCGAA